MTEEQIEVFENDEVPATDGYYTDSIAGNIPKYGDEENEVPENKFQETPPPSPDIPFLNTKPLAQESTTYRLEKFEKKILYIFNHVYVAGYGKRKGTEKDELKLRKVFENLGFELKQCIDLTLAQIFEVLNESNYLFHYFSLYSVFSIRF